MDQLEQRVNEFFVNAKKNKPEWREEQMEVIKKVPGLINLQAALECCVNTILKQRKAVDTDVIPITILLS